MRGSLESEQQLRLATEAAEIGLWDVDTVTDTLFWPPRVKAMFGISPDVPVSMADFYAGLHPDDKEATSAAFAAACDPQKRALYDVEYRTVGKEDGVIRWVAAKGRAIFDADGKCVRVIGTAIDISKRKEAEERQVLLAREVDHRARNALAVIQSIIRLTRAKTVDDYVQAIEGRIKALARAHTLLSDSRWHGADLATLVTEELAPYRGGDKITIRGPDISLQPATAQGLALAVHELATNAAKHGALSSPGGQITLDWQLQGDALTLNWTEKGRPRHCRAVIAQFWSQGHCREHRAAARRQGGVRLESERPLLRILHTAQRADQVSRVARLARRRSSQRRRHRLETQREAARASGRG